MGHLREAAHGSGFSRSGNCPTIGPFSAAVSDFRATCGAGKGAQTRCSSRHSGLPQFLCAARFARQCPWHPFRPSWERRRKGEPQASGGMDRGSARRIAIPLPALRERLGARAFHIQELDDLLMIGLGSEALCRLPLFPQSVDVRAVLNEEIDDFQAPGLFP